MTTSVATPAPRDWLRWPAMTPLSPLSAFRDRVEQHIGLVLAALPMVDDSGRQGATPPRKLTVRWPSVLSLTLLGGPCRAE